MADWMILVSAAAAAVMSFAWLALAMQGHWEQVHGAGGPSRGAQTALRVAGALGLSTSGVLCFMADRPSMAILLWVMLMAFGAVAVTFTLAWKPSILQFVWPSSSIAD